MMLRSASTWLLMWLFSLTVPATSWSVATLVNGDRTHAGATNAGVSTGATNTYVLTLNKAIPAYARWSCYLFEAHAANTGPATLNVNGKGAKAIVKTVDGALVPLAANDIGIGNLVEVCYDNVNMQAKLGGGGGGGGGTGDITTVGSCTTGDCFTLTTPGTSIVFTGPGGGTVTLQTVTGALGGQTVRLKAETGDLCTSASVCTGYQPLFGNLTNDAQLKRSANDFAPFTVKAVPVGADRLLIEDSAAGFAKKYVEISALPGGGGGGAGDVTAVGACGTGDCYTSGTPAGPMYFTAAAAPGPPSPGSGVLYLDSLNKNINIKDDAGLVKHGVQTQAGSPNQFLTSINAAGLVGLAQPSFTNLSGSLACSQHPALTGGNVTSAAGSCITTLASIPTNVPAAGSIVYTAIAAPATPGANTASLYLDNVTENLTLKNDANVLTHMVQARTPVAGQFVTGMNAAGLLTPGTVAFTNVTGSLACSQHPALAGGNVTSPAGSCVATLASIPANVPAAGSIIYTAIAAPGPPALGTGVVYFESISKNLAVKDDAGLVKHTVQTRAPVTTPAIRPLTGVSATGAWSDAQLSLGDLTDGNTVITAISTHVLENKKLKPGEVTLTIDGSNNVAVNVNAGHIFLLEAMATNPTFSAPIGSGGQPYCSQEISFRLKSAVPRTLTWNAAYRGRPRFPLPTQTTGDGTTEDDFKFRLNCVDNKWVLMSSSIPTTSTTGYLNLPVTAIKLHGTAPLGPDSSGLQTTLPFDDVTQQCVLWETTLPGDYVGSPVLELRYAMSSDTTVTHSATFDFRVWAVKAGETITTALWGTNNNCDDAAIPGALGVWNDITCAITNNDSMAPNDAVQFELCSDVGTGTWTGKLQVFRARLTYAK